MKGLRVGNERVSSPFFILQCLKEHSVWCCKDTLFPVKIDSNTRILFVMILYSWFCLEECIVKCNFVSIILQGGKLNQHMKAINRIKVVLAEKQLSGKWLANEIGCTENTVSRWCSNKVQPSLENLLEIAEVLKVDIRELLRSSKEQV